MLEKLKSLSPADVNLYIYLKYPEIYENLPVGGFISGSFAFSVIYQMLTKGTQDYEEFPFRDIDVFFLHLPSLFAIKKIKEKFIKAFIEHFPAENYTKFESSMYNGYAFEMLARDFHDSFSHKHSWLVKDTFYFAKYDFGNSADENFAFTRGKDLASYYPKKFMAAPFSGLLGISKNSYRKHLYHYIEPVILDIEDTKIDKGYVISQVHKIPYVYYVLLNTIVLNYIYYKVLTEVTKQSNGHYSPYGYYKYKNSPINSISELYDYIQSDEINNHIYLYAKEVVRQGIPPDTVNFSSVISNEISNPFPFPVIKSLAYVLGQHSYEFSYISPRNVVLPDDTVLIEKATIAPFSKHSKLGKSYKLYDISDVNNPVVVTNRRFVAQLKSAPQDAEYLGHFVNFDETSSDRLYSTQEILNKEPLHDFITYNFLDFDIDIMQLGFYFSGKPDVNGNYVEFDDLGKIYYTPEFENVLRTKQINIVFFSNVLNSSIRFIDKANTYKSKFYANVDGFLEGLNQIYTLFTFNKSYCSDDEKLKSILGSNVAKVIDNNLSQHAISKLNSYSKEVIDKFNQYFEILEVNNKHYVLPKNIEYKNDLTKGFDIEKVNLKLAATHLIYQCALNSNLHKLLDVNKIDKHNINFQNCDLNNVYTYVNIANVFVHYLLSKLSYQCGNQNSFFSFKVFERYFIKLFNYYLKYRPNEKFGIRLTEFFKIFLLAVSSEIISRILFNSSMFNRTEKVIKEFIKTYVFHNINFPISHASRLAFLFAIPEFYNYFKTLEKLKINDEIISYIDGRTNSSLFMPVYSPISNAIFNFKFYKYDWRHSNYFEVSDAVDFNSFAMNFMLNVPEICFTYNLYNSVTFNFFDDISSPPSISLFNLHNSEIEKLFSDKSNLEAFLHFLVKRTLVRRANVYGWDYFSMNGGNNYSLADNVMEFLHFGLKDNFLNLIFDKQFSNYYRIISSEYIQYLNEIIVYSIMFTNDLNKLKNVIQVFLDLNKKLSSFELQQLIDIDNIVVKGVKFSVKHLNTSEKLKREGAEMLHCVGGYSGSVATFNSLIFSLTDEFGIRSTVEYSFDENDKKLTIVQHRSKNNSSPDPMHIKAAYALARLIQREYDIDPENRLIKKKIAALSY